MKSINKADSPATGRGITRAVSALTLGGLLAAVHTASAQSFAPPPSNPPDNSGTNSAPVGLNDINIETPSTQSVGSQQVAVSGDFLEGYGKITLPFGFGITKNSALIVDTVPNVALRTRSSTYYGGTFSYSFNSKWSLDFSSSVGSSTATSPELFANHTEEVSFTVDDTWYQLYARYNLPLDSKSFSTYVRGGATFIDSTLTGTGPFNLGFVTPSPYEQHDSVQDVEGNLGFGAAYSFVSRPKLRISAIGEGEGFAGERFQDDTESLNILGAAYSGTDKFNNLVYGGLARATVRFEYFPGKSKQWRMYLDGGVQSRFTEIDYSIGDHTEVLWGPYVKLGIKYSF